MDPASVPALPRSLISVPAYLLNAYIKALRVTGPNAPNLSYLFIPSKEAAARSNDGKPVYKALHIHHQTITLEVEDEEVEGSGLVSTVMYLSNGKAAQQSFRGENTETRGMAAAASSTSDIAEPPTTRAGSKRRRGGDSEMTAGDMPKRDRPSKKKKDTAWSYAFVVTLNYQGKDHSIKGTVVPRSINNGGGEERPTWEDIMHALDQKLVSTEKTTAAKLQEKIDAKRKRKYTRKPKAHPTPYGWQSALYMWKFGGPHGGGRWWDRRTGQVVPPPPRVVTWVWDTDQPPSARGSSTTSIPRAIAALTASAPAISGVAPLTSSPVALETSRSATFTVSTPASSGFSSSTLRSYSFFSPEDGLAAISTEPDEFLCSLDRCLNGDDSNNAVTHPMNGPSHNQSQGPLESMQPRAAEGRALQMNMQYQIQAQGGKYIRPRPAAAYAYPPRMNSSALFGDPYSSKSSAPSVQPAIYGNGHVAPQYSAPNTQSTIYGNPYTSQSHPAFFAPATFFISSPSSYALVGPLIAQAPLNYHSNENRESDILKPMMVRLSYENANLMRASQLLNVYSSEQDLLDMLGAWQKHFDEVDEAFVLVPNRPEGWHYTITQQASIDMADNEIPKAVQERDRLCGAFSAKRVVFT